MKSGAPWGAAALVAPAFLFAYSTVFASLVAVWYWRNDYSHGFLIPFVCGYFVWQSRETLRSTAARPALASGTLLLALACALLVTGQAASVEALQQASLLIAVPGTVLLVLGWKHLRAMALPLGYLVFGIPPVFDALTGPLHWPFQRFSAAGAAFLLDLLGIPVYRSGAFLSLPNQALEVARACSGVRFLVSIVALAIPLGLLTQSRASRRVLLVVAAVLIGVFLNPVRIALIGLWARQGGALLHGPFHILQGMFVSVVGFCLIFVMAWVMAEPRPAGARGAAPSLRGEAATATQRRSIGQAVFAAVLLLGGAGVWIRVGGPLPVPPPAHIGAFPLALGPWRQVPSSSGAGYALQGADATIDRVYRHPQGMLVRLQVGYYELQRQGKELVSYRLDDLYRRARHVQIGEGQERFEANLSLIPGANGAQQVLFWHHVGGRDAAGTLMTRALTARGWVLGRNSGWVVIVAADGSGPDLSGEEAQRLAGFAGLARGALMPEGPGA